MRHALLAFLLGCLPLAAQAEGISVSGLTELPKADVVILGELHDSAIQHRNQAVALRALHPKAVVFEMLSEAQVVALSGVDRTDIEAVRMATGWDETGWPALELYWPVFMAVPSAAFYGGWVPREELRAAFGKGAAEVFGAEAARYGLDQPLPKAEQSEREAVQFDAHCQAMPMDMMGGMVDSQRLRDARLAQAALTALADTGGPVAIITGNGHARRDWGVPAVLAQAAPDVSVLSIGQFEARPEGAAPYDYWVVTAPTERGDPCEGLRG